MYCSRIAWTSSMPCLVTEETLINSLSLVMLRVFLISLIFFINSFLLCDSRITKSENNVLWVLPHDVKAHFLYNV